MRQEELSADHLVRDLVVIGLAVQLDEGGVGSEVIPTPGGGGEGNTRCTEIQVRVLVRVLEEKQQ